MSFERGEDRGDAEEREAIKNSDTPTSGRRFDLI